MLNDARISGGKPPLGFLNPWLYKNGYAKLNDITVGNNPGCGTQGFNATVGWDPGMSYRFYFILLVLFHVGSTDDTSITVTGLGTPDFNKLLPSALFDV